MATEHVRFLPFQSDIGNRPLLLSYKTSLLLPQHNLRHFHSTRFYIHTSHHSIHTTPFPLRSSPVPFTLSSRHLRALLSVCGGCSFGGLGCCSCRVCVCVCRWCFSLSVCVCVCVTC